MQLFLSDFAFTFYESSRANCLGLLKAVS